MPAPGSRGFFGLIKYKSKFYIYFKQLLNYFKVNTYQTRLLNSTPDGSNAPGIDSNLATYTESD